MSSNESTDNNGDRKPDHGGNGDTSATAVLHPLEGVIIDSDDRGGITTDELLDRLSRTTLSDHADEQKNLWLTGVMALATDTFCFKRFELLNLYNILLLQHRLVKLSKEIGSRGGMVEMKTEDELRTTLSRYRKLNQ